MTAVKTDEEGMSHLTHMALAYWVNSSMKIHGGHYTVQMLCNYLVELVVNATEDGSEEDGWDAVMRYMQETKEELLDSKLDGNVLETKKNPNDPDGELN